MKYIPLVLLGILASINVAYLNSYSDQTNNVLEAAAELKANGINYDICNINGVPCCVFKVGDELFFYDGLLGSNFLEFAPSESVAKNYVLPTRLEFPQNGCLIQALVEYHQHLNAPYDIIAFLPNHAMNVYAFNESQFDQEMSELDHYHVLAIFINEQFIEMPK